MWQKDFAFTSIDEVMAGIEELQGILATREHADALVHILSDGLSTESAQHVLDVFDARLPGVKRVGATEFPYDWAAGVDYIMMGLEEPSVRVNVMLSQEATFQTGQIPCAPGGEREAGRALSDALGGFGELKALMLYPANAALDLVEFLSATREALKGIPVFGAVAASGADAQGNKLEEVGSFGIGDTLLESGFTFVAFCGENLHAYLDYILGWRAIGGEMQTIVAPRSATDEANGVVALIDGAPALEVYDRYLGVKWDENFILNICEFPLMVHRNGLDICLVPGWAGEAGELYFAGNVYPGEKLRFSYGTRESVIGSARAGSERMRAFGAQAVFMSLCGNRVNFLRDEAHVEWDLYREANPELSYCHGQGEIAWKDGRGGMLNSALVALGLREGACACAGAGAGEVDECDAETLSSASGRAAAPDAAAPALAASGTNDGARYSGPLVAHGFNGERRRLADASDEVAPIPLSFRVSRFFEVMTGELLHLQHNLEDEVERKTRENQSLSLHLVEALAAAIDAKDTYTNGHSGRVAAYSREIARRAGYSGDRLNDIYVMGVLHDVGKIGVPDAVITKPGRLTDEEFAFIKEHPAMGARILAAVDEMPGLAVGAHWHHERYDGRGYPDGLAGEDIPEEARIIAVADAYDAMTSNRSYRDAMPQAKVREQVEQGRGTQFDPTFADIMLAMIDEDVDYRMREMGGLG